MKYSTSISTLAIALITTIITTSAVTAIEGRKTKIDFKEQVPGSVGMAIDPGRVFVGKKMKGTYNPPKAKKRNSNKTKKVTK